MGHLRVIDHDRIEEHNVSTQLYGDSEIGTAKVEALRTRLFRATALEIDAVRKELTEQSVKQLLKESSLVLDTFDNSRSRQCVQTHCRAAGIACLHVGLHADYCEIIWDEQYREPRDVAGDVCEYALARNVVMLAVAIASESILRFAASGEKESWTATLGDFSVRRRDPV